MVVIPPEERTPFPQDISHVSFVPVKPIDSTDSLSRITTQWKHSTTKSITNTFFLIYEGKNGVPVLKNSNYTYQNTHHTIKNSFSHFFVVALGVHFETEDVLRDGPMYVLWCLFKRFANARCPEPRIQLINLVM